MLVDKQSELMSDLLLTVHQHGWVNSILKYEFDKSNVIFPIYFNIFLSLKNMSYVLSCSEMGGEIGQKITPLKSWFTIFVCKCNKQYR